MSPSVTDTELVCRVRAGDRSALDALYQKHLTAVWRYVYARIGRDRAAAEDVVSEIFLTVLTALGNAKKGFSPERGTFAAWLIGVANHKLGDHHRAAAQRHSAAAARARDLAPEAAQDAADRRDQIVSILNRMPAEERQVVEWKYLDGLTVGEMAARLGRTPKAVESVLYRARERFRALMGTTAGWEPDTPGGGNQ